MLEILHAFEEDENRVLLDMKESVRYWKTITSWGMKLSWIIEKQEGLFLKLAKAHNLPFFSSKEFLN